MKFWNRALSGFALATALTVISTAAADDKQKSPPAEKGHDHPTVGPHKGVLAEWGEEEYHVELVFDDKNKQATIYILDGTAKKAKPIAVTEVTLTLKQKPPVTVKLKSTPDKGDPEGQSSRFVAKHDAFAKHQDLEGTISAKIGTKPYSGDFKAKHDHKHDHK